MGNDDGNSDSDSLVIIIILPTCFVAKFNRILPYVNVFDTSPALRAMSVLWIREHNRVCDVLVRKWPSWTDDEVYKIARRIVTGEMMGIMMNDIIGVHTGHAYPVKLKPEIFDDRLENVNVFETPFELFLITMWPTGFQPAQLLSNAPANDNNCKSCCNE